ncbi:unnamed protein product [Owenia fusiformis]|uniref:Uncharacterized protein n=1 Tax=Owenia fusiformis TaxID=6347 RepID=A0A8J1UYG6_OWEFU|nr:unnamed protein product [Owenia fusiformis]
MAYKHLVTFMGLLMAFTSEVQGRVHCMEGKSDEFPDNVNITTSCGMLKANVGEQIEIQCILNPALAIPPHKIDWINPNGTNVRSNTTGAVHQTNGTLMIKNADLKHTGVYTCIATNGTFVKEVHINIYEIPSYLFEGMIIVAINGVLLVIFTIGLAISVIRQRREEKLSGGFQKQKKPKPSKHETKFQKIEK